MLLYTWYNTPNDERKGTHNRAVYCIHPVAKLINNIQNTSAKRVHINYMRMDPKVSNSSTPP